MFQNTKKTLFENANFWGKTSGKIPTLLRKIAIFVQIYSPQKCSIKIWKQLKKKQSKQEKFCKTLKYLLRVYLGSTINNDKSSLYFQS